MKYEILRRAPYSTAIPPPVGVLLLGGGQRLPIAMGTIMQHPYVPSKTSALSHVLVRHAGGHAGQVKCSVVTAEKYTVQVACSAVTTEGPLSMCNG